MRLTVSQFILFYKIPPIFCRPGYESFKKFYIGYYSGIDGGGIAV